MKMRSVFSLRKWIRFFLEHHTLSNRLSDSAYVKLAYYSKMGTRLNLDHPVTFNEKMQWLKLHDRNPEYTRMVDKHAVKEYISEVIGEQYVIPTLGVWERFEEIDFANLPERFVLKCTHDSGGLVICRNKANLDIEAAREKITRSLMRNYFWSGREWPYKDVKPQIIAEMYMEDNEANSGLTDYKFFCFHGKPRMIYVSKGLEDHKTASISFFDLNGNRLPFCRSDYRPIAGQMFLPREFDKMIEIAQTLAQKVNNPFVRVDMYSIQGKIYFSELTFSPCNGMIPFSPPEWDKKLGELIVLPQSK